MDSLYIVQSVKLCSDAFFSIDFSEVARAHSLSRFILRLSRILIWQLRRAIYASSNAQRSGAGV